MSDSSSRERATREPAPGEPAPGDVSLRSGHTTAARRSWRESQLAQLTFIRFREFVREPEAMFWVFIFPILMAAGLGIAFRGRGEETSRVAAVEQRGEPHLHFRELLSKAKGLDIVLTGRDSALALLRAGKVDLVVIDAGAGTLDYRFDPARAESRSARLAFDDALQRALGRVSPLNAVDNTISEPGSRYIDFVVPGLLGMNLLGSGVWGLGFALVDMRRKKLLKRLVATPMSRPQFLASFLLSRLLLLIVEVAALVGFGALVFGVPLRGPIWVLALIAILGSFAFSGLGLLISSRVRTLEGASGLMNAAMLPMWIFSGVFFSSSHFPDVIQPAIRLLPLTAVNDALRLNMLEGASVVAVLPQLAVIGGWALVCYVLAIRMFRWQ